MCDVLKANLTWHVKKNGEVLDDLCSSMSYNLLLQNFCLYFILKSIMFKLSVYIYYFKLSRLG